MSSEELLEQALVREEDWPYAVPGNWVWVRLDKVLLNLTDGSHFSPKTVEKGYPYITVRDLTNGTIDFDNCKMISKDDYDTLSRNNCQPFEGDVLFSKDGTVGKVALIDFNRKFVVLLSLAILKPNIKIVISEYIEKVLTSPQVLSQAINSKTGTAIKRLVLKNLKNILVPLPPLAEQQRIVDRIESLFDKLDLAKELVQEALDSFENRKAAIFHQAFTGELTKKWREAHGVGLESWSIRPLSELCTSFQYGTSKKSLTSGKVVVIRMGNLQQGEIRWDSLAYTDDKEDIEKYLLKNGDVLFNRTNSPELVGKTSVYRGEFSAIFAGYLIRLKNDDMLNSYYLNYMMNSQRAKIYCNSVKTDGVNQSNINAKKIAAFEIPHCSIPEQQEIVRILDDLFSKDQNAKDLIDLIDQIEAMKKTILGKAFRGQLGTNEAGEESAVVFLRKVLSKDK